MRTKNNNELRFVNVGEKVTLVGWCSKKRNLGGVVFIDLRDRCGIIQLVVEPDNENYQLASEVKNEYVLKATGHVVERESKNPNLETGDVEVIVEELEILNTAENPPLLIQDQTDALEDTRMKYRYLDLRRPTMQHNLIVRHKTTIAVRNYFDENGFIEIETPYLGKSTPEGARDFLVPSRVHTGSFYALPQSPQLYKQLLMVAGFDKYFQIAKCFRDEDLRADRQLEFTQIDVEMSFVDEEDIYKVLEGLLKRVWKETLNQDIVTPFIRMEYDDAMNYYGSDKPDTRFEMLLQDMTEWAKDIDFGVFQHQIAAGGKVKGIVANNAALKYSRKEIDRLTEMAKKYHIELEVLSSLTRAKGTIVKEATNVEKMLISGVAKDENVARISVIGVPDKPGLAFRIFSKLAQKNVNVDIILQSIGRNGTKDISFTVEKDKMDATIELMQSYVETIGASSVVFDDDVAKVSIVGAGMESHPGVASDMFEALFEANVNIQMISTSEIKISVLIKKEDANKAVAAIHAKFFEQIGQ